MTIIPTLGALDKLNLVSIRIDLKITNIVFALKINLKIVRTFKNSIYFAITYHNIYDTCRNFGMVFRRA